MDAILHKHIIKDYRTCDVRMNKNLVHTLNINVSVDFTAGKKLTLQCICSDSL